jgi:hypothetical protein
MLLVMPQFPTPIHSPNSELELRRHVDRAIGRALVDHHYAVALLADPTMALKGTACPPGHNAELQRIHALSIEDFACQVLEMFSYPSLEITLCGNAGLEPSRLAA